MEAFSGKGVLEYSGNWTTRPWLLKQADGTKVDLYPLIDKLLLQMNGKPAMQSRDEEFYRITFPESAQLVLNYTSDKGAFLAWPKTSGECPNGVYSFTNLLTHIPSNLTRLSGRVVEITIDDTGILIEPDASVEVFGVRFSRTVISNSCPIPEGAEKTICKVGTADCCIFMSEGPDGFNCEKFSGSTARYILQRHRAGDMRASRVGDCKIVSWEDGPAPQDSPPATVPA